MTTISISELPDSKLQELAVRGSLKGVMVDYCGVEIEPGVQPEGGYEIQTSSTSEPDKFHTVTIWQEAKDQWFGECDKGIKDEDACQANRLGGKCCSHLALSLFKLKQILLRSDDNDKLG